MHRLKLKQKCPQTKLLHKNTHLIISQILIPTPLSWLLPFQIVITKLSYNTSLLIVQLHFNQSTMDSSVGQNLQDNWQNIWNWNCSGASYKACTIRGQSSIIIILLLLWIPKAMKVLTPSPSALSIDHSAASQLIAIVESTQSPHHGNSHMNALRKNTTPRPLGTCKGRPYVTRSSLCLCASSH
jgi:hypothetical protein